jgi:hypothetical protein
MLRLAEWRNVEVTERKILRIRKPPFEQSCGSSSDPSGQQVRFVME